MRFIWLTLALALAGCASGGGHQTVLDRDQELALEELCDDLEKPDTASDVLGPMAGGLVKHLPVFGQIVDSADERRKKAKCAKYRRTFSREENVEDNRHYQQCVANPCMYREYCIKEFGDDFLPPPKAYCEAPPEPRQGRPSASLSPAARINHVLDEECGDRDTCSDSDLTPEAIDRYWEAVMELDANRGKMSAPDHN